jgi:amidase
MPSASTFIVRTGEAAAGIRLAVKDLIDMAGYPTTAGCRAVADRAQPASVDAPCLAGARAAQREGRVSIVGKANLHELACGGSGLNPWFGNPVNPLDPTRIPGGSSSGSAVAVATGEADVAYGSDTGGSVRTPSACCGTAGLKTTHGRISLDGVWPLAQSLDTIGPMARDVGGLIAGMQLLEPGFTVAAAAPSVVGRFRGLGADPAIEAALDRVLAAAELDVVDIYLPGWAAATSAAVMILVREGWLNDRALVEDHPEGVGADVAERLRFGAAAVGPLLDEARAAKAGWRAQLAAVFQQVQVIALPTLVMFPPPVDDPGDQTVTANAAVNLAGHPSLALPVPSGDSLPASLQLVGPDGSEDELLALGRVVEAAVASLT